MNSVTGTFESGGSTAAGSGVPFADVIADAAPGVVTETVEVGACGDGTRRAPGRPRSARADEAIVEAVLDLLADGTSLDALSMEAVAYRAGVGKATIYRRWPNKEALVIDALRELKGPLPTIAGESIRDDLLTLLRPLATVRTTRAGRVMRCMMSELQRNPDFDRLYHELSEPRRQLMRAVLHRGMASGELRADLDVTATMAMLVGPLISQSMLNWYPGLDIAAMPEKIVDSLLPGLLAR
jgi:AcrR family transcriptional regulator